ncbi:hypothetical protein [Arcobacter arenosus]|uniref:Lipoprotein n=1 Tax=Arcobacter arenosus TaxID=2576037 RepID=A0A5R8Y3S3_9BACT|nr:hypothetical protein [Arcobacter arenosus]TLP40511.1 hypothetical protein FDK22_00425 [Arcobacter arenosus]
MEKLKHFRFVFLFNCLALLIGCAENQQISISSNKNLSSKKINQVSSKKENISSFIKSKEIDIKEMKIENRNGILFVEDKIKEYVISSNGLDYNSHLSRDKKILVVDVLKTNNLQTIEIFSKKDSSIFKRVKSNLKKDLWNSNLKDKTYKFKDIKNPQLKFYKWVGNDTFDLTLSYEFNDKFYENMIRYNVYN